MLERLKVNNILVVVTRWFGGVMLGADRFKHITGVAKQVSTIVVNKQSVLTVQL